MKMHKCVYFTYKMFGHNLLSFLFLANNYHYILIVIIIIIIIISIQFGIHIFALSYFCLVVLFFMLFYIPMKLVKQNKYIYLLF
jgi:hypothetical protein